ncbi:unnamed protein product, partial [Musa hybrid cultivar]
AASEEGRPRYIYRSGHRKQHAVGVAGCELPREVRSLGRLLSRHPVKFSVY